MPSASAEAERFRTVIEYWLYGCNIHTQVDWWVLKLLVISILWPTYNMNKLIKGVMTQSMVDELRGCVPHS